MEGFAELHRQDIREYWNHEASEFTPWLAQRIEAPERSRLEEIVGLDLEVVGTEYSIGRYNLDVLAETINSEVSVVIENQLTPSDHDHLGKSLVYASGIDADVIVWIAPEFREEHQAAVQWINSNTTQDVDLFAITVDVWQIEDSEPALELTVIEEPNSWTGVRPERSSTKRIRKQFWERLRDRLQESETPLHPNTPSGQNYYRISLPQDGYHLTFHAYKQDRIIDCTINVPKVDEIWDEINNKSDEIKATFDDSVEFFGAEAENKTARYTVKVTRDADIFADDADWDSHHTWLITQAERLRELARNEFPRRTP